MVENDGAKILWDSQIQTNKLVLTDQPDIVLIDKQERKAVVIDVAQEKLCEFDKQDSFLDFLSF